MTPRRRGRGSSSAKAEGPLGSDNSEQDTSTPGRLDGNSSEELASAERIERDAAKHRAKPSGALERVLALALVAISIAGVIGSRSIDVANETGGFDPRWWPTIITAISLLLSIMLTVVAFTKPPFDRDDIDAISQGGWYPFTVTVILTSLFVVAWQLTGNFVVPCAIMLGALIWAYGGRGWKALLLFPVLTTTLLYLLFHTLLKVPL